MQDYRIYLKVEQIIIITFFTTELVNVFIYVNRQHYLYLEMEVFVLN